jgi:hypothetical protein
MSVFINDEEIKTICTALYWDKMGMRKYAHIFTTDRTLSDDDYRQEVYNVFNRVYIANQIAYILTYAHHEDLDKEIDLLDYDGLWNDQPSCRTTEYLYRTLESIEYNLYSNGGQMVLGFEDLQKLKDLMAVLARDVVGKYQREIKGGQKP